MATLTRIHLIGAALLGVMIFAAMLFIGRRGAVPQETGMASLPPASTSSPDDVRLQTGEDERVASTAPPYRGAPVSELDGDPKTAAQVPEHFELARAELAEIAVKLAENPRQPPLWMRVAYLKHFFGDEAGTADAYEYLNVIAPGDPIPFYNLAAIYGYYLKQPEKAIPKYRAAIERDPAVMEYYYGFGNFLREVRRDLAAAEKTFLQGLARVPAYPPLLSALGALYVETGETAKAIEYYERALDNPALSSGERAAIEAEVERLKQRPSP